MIRNRIYLSPPNVGEREQRQVVEALKSGWVAPVGPFIDQFENVIEQGYENMGVVALNSGTSALHMALILAGVKNDDEVLVSSFTFAACANVIRYQGATPIFLDSEDRTWNLDPEVLSTYLSNCKEIPKALIVTHLYGMPAAIKEIVSIAKAHDIIVIEDAAEALGSSIESKSVGCFGDYGILSFNGNKIVTTGGGGALICSKEDKERAIFLATQANSGHLSYDHKEVGYNYRMSNVLAGIGLSQLELLKQFIAKKKHIYNRYQSELGNFFTFLDEPDGLFSNRWLTTCLINDDYPVMDLITFLNDRHIETRRLWKPLHMHDAFCDFPFKGTHFCDRIFERGICLPSGTGLTEEEQAYAIDSIKSFINQ